MYNNSAEDRVTYTVVINDYQRATIQRALACLASIATGNISEDVVKEAALLRDWFGPEGAALGLIPDPGINKFVF